MTQCVFQSPFAFGFECAKNGALHDEVREAFIASAFRRRAEIDLRAAKSQAAPCTQEVVRFAAMGLVEARVTLVQ